MRNDAQMPVKEAAAAGKLVITCKTAFSRSSLSRGAIIAPIESKKYQEFVVRTLNYTMTMGIVWLLSMSAEKYQTVPRRFDWEFLESVLQCRNLVNASV